MPIKYNGIIVNFCQDTFLIICTTVERHSQNPQIVEIFVRYRGKRSCTVKTRACNWKQKHYNQEGVIAIQDDLTYFRWVVGSRRSVV